MEPGLVLLTWASCSSLHPCTMPRVWLKKINADLCRLHHLDHLFSSTGLDSFYGRDLWLQNTGEWSPGLWLIPQGNSLFTLYLCLSLYVYMHMHACTCAHRQIPTESKRESRILEPELQVFVSHPTWVTRTEFLPNVHTVWVLLPLGHLCISHFWYLVISIYHFILVPSLSWCRYRVVLEFSTLLLAPSLNPCYTVHPKFFVLEPALYRCYLWDGKGPAGKTQDRMKVKVSGHEKIKANWVEAEERKSCYLENHLGVTQVGALWSRMATDFL